MRVGKGKITVNRQNSLSSVRQGDENRILYYDYLESIAIFFVVSIHRLWLDETVLSNLSYFLWRSAVPLFFMVHGALLLGRDLTMRQIGRRFLRALCQLIVWETVYLPISLVAGRITLEDVTLGALYHYFVDATDFGGISIYHLWFTYALLFVYLCLPIVQVCQKQNPKLLWYIAGVCLVFSIGKIELNTLGTYLGELWFGSAVTVSTLFDKLTVFGQYRIYLFYFIVGYLLAQWAAKQPKGQTRYLLPSSAAICGGLALMLLEYRMSYGTIAYTGSTLSDEYARLGTALLSIGLFVLFSQIDFQHCPLNRAAIALSKRTLDIYYLHMIFLVLLEPFYKGSHSEWASVPANYLKAAVILVISYGVGCLLRKVPGVRKIL